MWTEVENAQGEKGFHFKNKIDLASKLVFIRKGNAFITEFWSDCKEIGLAKFKI